MTDARTVSYRWRVMILSAAVSMMFAALGAFTWWRLSEVQAQAEAVSTATEAYIEMSRALDLANDLVEPAKDAVLFDEPERGKEYQLRYGGVLAQVDRLLAEDDDLHDQLRHTRAELVAADLQVEEALGLLSQGSLFEAGAAISRAEAGFGRAMPTLDRIHHRASGNMKIQLGAMHATAGATLTAVLTACAMVILLNTLLSFVLTRQILATIGSNSHRIARSAEEMNRVGQTIGDNADDTFNQANAASAAAEVVSRHVQSVAMAAEEMNSSVQEIAQSVHEVSRVANSAVSMADDTNRIMGKLAASSEQIGAVVKVITTIARQTNLLALNATIEAASAGDAGRGFAVVAKEVKELAKETAKATDEISSQINAIQEDTHDAIGAIEEIGDIINRISEIQGMVATAVEQQTVSTSEIQRRMADAAHGSSEIALNITSVAQTAETTSSGINASMEAANNVRLLAQDLQQRFA